MQCIESKTDFIVVYVTQKYECIYQANKKVINLLIAIQTILKNTCKNYLQLKLFSKI